MPLISFLEIPYLKKIKLLFNLLLKEQSKAKHELIRNNPFNVR